MKDVKIKHLILTHGTAQLYIKKKKKKIQK